MKVALLLSVKIAELTVFARQCLNFLVVEKETFLIADSTFFCVRPLFGKVRLTTKHAVIEHCWRETDKKLCYYRLCRGSSLLLLFIQNIFSFTFWSHDKGLFHLIGLDFIVIAGQNSV